MPARAVNHVALQIAEARWQISRRYPARIGMQSNQVEKIDDVLGKADADGHIADGVLEDEIPADNPGDEFAHGGIGVSVSAAGDGNHGGELGVTDGSKST